ncbi:MAG: hypothetical protein WCR54_07535 [Clostridia bacterium]
MKKLLTGLLVVLTIVGLTGVLVACDIPTTNSETATNDSENYSYVTIDTVPEVEFIVQDGVVSTYNASNEEAELILVDSDLEGMPIEDAVEEVIDMSVEAGLIDVDTEGEEVEVGAIDEDGETDEETYGLIEEHMHKYFAEHGILGRVSQETLDAYSAQAEELGLSKGNVKILLVACDVTGKSIDELKDTPINELLDLIHTTRKEQCENNGVGQQFGRNKDLSENANLSEEELQQLREERQADCDNEEAKINTHSRNFSQNKANIQQRIKEFQSSKKGTNVDQQSNNGSEVNEDNGNEASKGSDNQNV